MNAQIRGQSLLRIDGRLDGAGAVVDREIYIALVSKAQMYRHLYSDKYSGNIDTSVFVKKRDPTRVNHHTRAPIKGIREIS